MSVEIEYIDDVELGRIPVIIQQSGKLTDDDKKVIKQAEKEVADRIDELRKLQTGE